MGYVSIFSCLLAFILAGANLLSLASVSWWVVFAVFPGIPLAILLALLTFAGIGLLIVWVASRGR